MGFGRIPVWIIGYWWLMGFGTKITINQIGLAEILWLTGGYGFSDVWVRGVSSVVKYFGTLGDFYNKSFGLIILT